MINGYQSQILKIYENIREKESKQLKARKDKIHKEIPEIKQIEDKIARLSIELSMNILKNLDNKEQYLKELKEKITDLRMHKTELLVSNNYPMDYLEIHYKCPKCKDTGFIGNKKCSCYRHRLVYVYYKNSDFKDTLLANNLNNFNLDLYSIRRTGDEIKSPRKNMEEILVNVKHFIQNFKNQNTNLLFYGTSGTGKTFLSNCISKELLDRGHLVVYRTAKELIENLREARFAGNDSLEDLILNCDLLVIDDLGTEQLTDFTKSELFNLLNTKLLKNKKMIVSTNFSIEQLSKHYSERITSRLFGNFDLFKFYGEDIRVAKNLYRNKL
ncbi:ATP-binding protein [Haloimpatiens sp. FM7330]|uniref:ATP-binding protein n=1 Tax=Haloimpatiens sp. FM7330 TaxID=3298610 RepID=UPI00362A1997